MASFACGLCFPCFAIVLFLLHDAEQCMAASLHSEDEHHFQPHYPEYPGYPQRPQRPGFPQHSRYFGYDQDPGYGKRRYQCQALTFSEHYAFSGIARTYESATDFTTTHIAGIYTILNQSLGFFVLNTKGIGSPQGSMIQCVAAPGKQVFCSASLGPFLPFSTGNSGFPTGCSCTNADQVCTDAKCTWGRYCSQLSGYITAASSSECQSFCANDDTCTAYTYIDLEGNCSSAKNRCYLITGPCDTLQMTGCRDGTFVTRVKQDFPITLRIDIIAIDEACIVQKFKVTTFSYFSGNQGSQYQAKAWRCLDVSQCMTPYDQYMW
eukprot:TRINITY_DN4559_c0_g1_i2.p1 TRINITY_DN4559_c0_g1~~TRINITY_DN4559_c0_g1_i2.p1  ORF type:complete len:322 (-),score=25.81 TRINITY_DN4559_c0_g1_i2:274-1239(-)